MDQKKLCTSLKKNLQDLQTSFEIYESKVPFYLSLTFFRTIAKCLLIIEEMEKDLS